MAEKYCSYCGCLITSRTSLCSQCGAPIQPESKPVQVTASHSYVYNPNYVMKSDFPEQYAKAVEDKKHEDFVISVEEYEAEHDKAVARIMFLFMLALFGIPICAWMSNIQLP